MPRAAPAAGAQAIIADTPRDLRLSRYATLTPDRRVYRYNLNYRPAQRTFGRSALLPGVPCWCFSRASSGSEPTAVSLDAAGPAHSQIPNGYDTARFGPDPRGRAARSVRPHRIAPTASWSSPPGKLARNKGHDVAFTRCGASAPGQGPVVYVVWATAAGKMSFAAWPAASAADVLHRLLASDRVAAALNAADLVVHPSLKEIFPNAVGEAMACGRPIVAADAGGTGELLGRTGRRPARPARRCRRAGRGDPRAVRRPDRRAEPSVTAARRRIETRVSARAHGRRVRAGARARSIGPRWMTSAGSPPTPTPR